MKERYEGNNRQNLIDALMRQQFVANNAELAEALANVGTIEQHDVGVSIVEQGSDSNDVYFILAGTVAVLVNGSQVALRGAGNYVGEMAAIEPSLTRAATNTVVQKIVALKVSSAGFREIGLKFPKTWIPIAQELARRLHERNKTIQPPNEQPKLFIMSSSEALQTARAIEDGLKPDVWSKCWDQGVFFAGGYPLEALEIQVAESDFAVAVAEPDDIIETRGKRSPTVRDNVLFELGLFMGKLTRFRTILVHPRIKDLKLPSDLQGLTLVPYDDGDPSTLGARVAPACETIREVIKRMGPLKQVFK